ncbi:hypothetical protein D3C78_1073480 [compost metagenome]
MLAHQLTPCRQPMYQTARIRSQGEAPVMPSRQRQRLKQPAKADPFGMGQFHRWQAGALQVALSGPLHLLGIRQHLARNVDQLLLPARRPVALPDQPQRVFDQRAKANRLGVHL